MKARVCGYLGVFLVLFAGWLSAAPEVRVDDVVVTGTGAATAVAVTYGCRIDPPATVNLTLEVSADGGDTWDAVPVVTVTGDLSMAATAEWQAGTLTWAAGTDWPEQYTDQAMVKVRAEPRMTVGDYLVVDVSAGPEATSYPVVPLQAVPDPLPDEYRTTKILLRRVPAGVFLMGSPLDELGRGANETLHEVTLTQGFYMGVFEVTQWQYQQVMGINPSLYVGDHHPVDQVSWDQARAGDWPGGTHIPADSSFIGRLRGRSERAFDLPTEAQWEYACRAGTTTAWNNGTRNTSNEEDANLNVLGRYSYNGGTAAHHAVVGSYLPNAWGLYDMHGNVLEWCLDWKDWDVYGSDPVTDPVGLSTGSVRALRGGSYVSNAAGCRAACRAQNTPAAISQMYGFRLCLPAGAP